MVYLQNNYKIHYIFKGKVYVSRTVIRTFANFRKLQILTKDINFIEITDI